MANVDVVVPCYNYGHFLKACVQSALAQEGVDVRVLIIDDASSDDSVAVAKELAHQDSRVRLIALTENVGMIRAMNRGVHEVDGDYFVKLDADDLLPPGSLQRSLALLQQYPNVGFVYGRPRHFSGERPPPPRLGRPRWMVWPGREWLELRCQRAVNCISQPEVVIRSSVLRAAGDYNADLPHTSDLEMWLRLAAISDVGRINGIDQGYYRVHPNSMQRTVNSGPLADLTGRRAAFLNFLATAGQKLNGIAELETAVRKSLAAQALDRICHSYDRAQQNSSREQQLVEFASTTYPAFATLPRWQEVERRRRRRWRSRWSPAALMASIARRTRGEWAHLRWMRTGV